MPSRSSLPDSSSHGSPPQTLRDLSGGFSRVPPPSGRSRRSSSFGDSVYAPPELSARAAADSFLAGNTPKRHGTQRQWCNGHAIVIVFVVVAVGLIGAVICTVFVATSASVFSPDSEQHASANDGDIAKNPATNSDGQQKRLKGGSLSAARSGEGANKAQPVFQVWDDDAEDGGSSTTAQADQDASSRDTQKQPASPEASQSSTTMQEATTSAPKASAADKNSLEETTVAVPRTSTADEKPVKETTSASPRTSAAVKMSVEETTAAALMTSVKAQPREETSAAEPASAEQGPPDEATSTTPKSSTTAALPKDQTSENKVAEQRDSIGEGAAERWHDENGGARDLFHMVLQTLNDGDQSRSSNTDAGDKVLDEQAPSAANAEGTGSDANYAAQPNIESVTAVVGKRRQTSGAFSEWEVVFGSPEDGSLVNVRVKPDLESDVLRTRKRGEIFMGEREGDWVKLVCEPGYVKIEIEDGVPLLKERMETYDVLESGSCTERSMFAISSSATCSAAAAALGVVSDTLAVATTTEGNVNPEGCFLTSSARGAPMLQLETSPAAWGAGARPQKSPICSMKAGTCKALMPTVAREPAPSGRPTLFCFTVMQGTQDEAELVRIQFAKGAGIFSCDSWSAFSVDRIRLNPGGLETVDIPQPPAGWGPPIPWVSRPLAGGSSLDVALGVWQTVVREGRTREQEWTAKVDPDAVFFPDRLRSHPDLVSRGSAKGPFADPPAVYFKNCRRPADSLALSYSAEFGGPLKVLSRSAVDVLISGLSRCYDEVHWLGMTEGEFMGACLDKLGASSVPASGVLDSQDCDLRDVESPPRDCDGEKAVFHPLRDRGSYFRCYAESQRAEAPTQAMV